MPKKKEPSIIYTSSACATTVFKSELCDVVKGTDIFPTPPPVLWIHPHTGLGSALPTNRRSTEHWHPAGGCKHRANWAQFCPKLSQFHEVSWLCGAHLIVMETCKWFLPADCVLAVAEVEPLVLPQRTQQNCANTHPPSLPLPLPARPPPPPPPRHDSSSSTPPPTPPSSSFCQLLCSNGSTEKVGLESVGETCCCWAPLGFLCL